MFIRPRREIPKYRFPEHVSRARNHCQLGRAGLSSFFRSTAFWNLVALDSRLNPSVQTGEAREWARLVDRGRTANDLDKRMDLGNLIFIDGALPETSSSMSVLARAS